MTEVLNQAQRIGDLLAYLSNAIEEAEVLDEVATQHNKSHLAANARSWAQELDDIKQTVYSFLE
jgi:hypothetical protein